MQLQKCKLLQNKLKCNMLQHAVMLLVYKFLYLNLQLIMEVDLQKCFQRYLGLFRSFKLFVTVSVVCECVL